MSEYYTYKCGDTSIDSGLSPASVHTRVITSHEPGVSTSHEPGVHTSHEPGVKYASHEPGVYTCTHYRTLGLYTTS